MARSYKIEGRSLFVDNGDGNGFQNKGNAGSTSNRELIRQITEENQNSGAGGSATDGKIKLTPTTTISSGGSTSLRYPEQINENTDYVTFAFYNYDSPFGRAEGEALNLVSGQDAFDFYNYSGKGREEGANKNAAKDLKKIILYMPEDIQSQYGANWGGAEFGTAAVGAMRAYGGESARPDVALGSLGGMGKTALYKNVLDQINKFTGSNINLNQFMGSVSGTILNPNTELLYEGGTLRTFSLSFKLTPKRKEEAIVIKQICNTFKKAMLPSYGGQAFGIIKAPNLITIPKLCQVTYMSGNNINSNLPAYKLCAITGVDVNYTADGAYATYEGGYPVSTKLTVGFKETKLLYDIDIDDKGGDSY
jgi:hypothetical protein